MEKIKENTTFKEGDVVVYGSQGICRITGTEKMRVGGVGGLNARRGGNPVRVRCGG